MEVYIMKKIIPVLFLSAFLIPTLANAQGYIGGSIGQSDYEDEETDTGFKIYGGYKVNQNFAIEGGYTDLGKISDGSASFSVDGLEIAAVGMLPVNPQFDVFGKVGLFLANTEASVAGLGSVDDDSNDIFFGLGVAYQVNQQVSIRGTYDFYGVDFFGLDIDIDLLAVGVDFKF